MARVISIVSRGLKEARAAMTKREKQIAFATAVALTKTAVIAQKAINGEMPKVFDRPTRFTLNSLFILPAKRDRLTAYVRMKDAGDRGAPAAKWLTPQIEGKARGDKGSEKRLRAKGLLRDGKHVVPASGTRLDRYGNISRRAMTNIIQGLDGGKYFTLGSPRDPAGIAQRRGRKGVKLALAFVSRPDYKRRLDFYGVGNRAVDKSLADEFRKAYAKATSTAR